MPSELPFEHSPRSDRRHRPTRAWEMIWRRGRRIHPRRYQERQHSYFVDLIDPSTSLLAILLIVLTIIDGAVTLLLLGAGCEEINPAMSYLLSQGPLYFLLGKYLLTTASLPFLLVFRHFPLFRTRFRVGHLLPIFVALYFVLLGYQIALMRTTVEPIELSSETKIRPCPMLTLSGLRTQDSGLRKSQV